MNRLASRLALGAGVVASCVASVRPARACGACFVPPKETTVVTDHRMAFSVSTQQTVLWDQIEYSGNPSDFSWVLPVKSGTVVQASSDAWFEALDAMTTPTITGPNRPCNGAGTGCGASKSQGFAASASGSAEPGVQVLSQSVVGPYDTATLKASNPNALVNWLDAHSYVLPPSFEPTIAAYVAGGFDFIALRLQPGVGVQAMQPVRVVTQGADVTLPLRMVAAGVGAQVGVTLYVVSEGRYEAAAPFANALIDDSKLVWLHTQGRSNYQELSLSLMAGSGGRTWLTEFSGQVEVTPSGQRSCGQGSTPYYYGQSLSDLYLSQCPCPPLASDAGPSLGGPVDSGAESTVEAGQEAASEASVPSAATSPTCTGDDLDVALVGLHPADIWVTRLRALLPANALSEHDLMLQAAATQTPVSNQHTASNYDDPSYSPCGTQGGGCAASASDLGDARPYLEIGALAFAFAAAARRARRRRR